MSEFSPDANTDSDDPTSERAASSSILPLEVRPPASPLLYLAAYIVTAAGLYAASNIVEVSLTGFLPLLLISAGFLVSYILRQLNIPPRAVEAPVILACALFCILAIVGSPLLSFLVGPNVSDDRARALTVLMVWLVVFRSFALLSDSSLLFCCVPSLALIGLTSTMTADPAMTIDFGVFLCAAAFMMVHENYQRMRVPPSLPETRPLAAPMLGIQLQVTALCVLGALVLARVAVYPLQSIGTRLNLTPDLAIQLRPDGNFSPPVRFDERKEVQVATGPTRLSNEVVMIVHSPESAYWRGSTFDEYTGHGWRSTFARDIELRPGDLNDPDPFSSSPANAPSAQTAFHIPSTPFTQADAPSHIVLQRVRLRNGIFNDIYAASEPRILRIDQIRAQMDLAGGIHLYRSVQNTVYEVESQIPDWSDESLRSVPAVYPSDITDRYLQLPLNDIVSLDHIRSAAQKVTASGTNAFDKVVALEEWIGKQCVYNIQARAVPVDQEVVSYFLFTSHEGYCDSFATTLAVMCRTIGIPARVASGFLPGETGEHPGDYIVRERDKHQWTEVYFNGYGWIPFDATGYARDVSNRQDGSGAGRSLAAFLFKRGWLPPFALLALGSMIVYLIKTEILDRRRRKAIGEGTLALPASNRAIIDSYEAACGLLARRGLPRPPYVTPREYAMAVTSRFGEAQEARDAFLRLTALLARYRYGRQEAAEAEVSEARELLQTLRRGYRRIPREAPVNIKPSTESTT